jgi:integrase
VEKAGTKKDQGLYWKLSRDGKRRQLYVVFNAGKKWSEKPQKMIPNQVWEMVLSNDLKDARALRGKRLAEVHNNTFSRPSRQTFADLAESWFHGMEGGDLRPHTLEHYRGEYRNHLLPYLGGMKVISITRDDIRTFKTKMEKDGFRKSTIQKKIKMIRQIFRHGVEEGWLETSPATVRMRYSDTREVKEIEPLTAAEVRVVLTFVRESDRWRPWLPLLYLAINTGMRVGELLAAKWENFDEAKRTYFVRENLTRKRTFFPPKTKSSKAPVDLSPNLIAALKEHRTRQIWLRQQAGATWTVEPEHEGLIFTTSTGMPVLHHYLTDQRRFFKSILREAGIREIRPHDLRHTCASLMISRGEHIKAVSKQMRHASTKITWDVYGHLYPEDLVAAQERFDKQIFG